MFPLQGYVAVFLWWVALVLVAAHLKCLYQADTCVTRGDYLIDVPQLCCWHGVGELFLVFSCALSAFFWCCFSVQYVAGSFCSHYSYLSSGVGQIYVCTDTF